VVRAVLAAMAAGEGTVEQILELARRHLEMDVAYVSRFTDGKQVYRPRARDPPPAVPCREPPDEPDVAHRRDHPDPARHRGPRLLRRKLAAGKTRM
jgi:hypothetical protein